MLGLHSLRSRGTLCALCSLGLVPALACLQTSTRVDPGRGPTEHPAGARDDPATRVTRVMTWNVTWFQHPGHAPDDDARQYDAVRELLAEQRPTLLALQEVSDADAFARLLADLSPLSGVLSSYAWVQKTALLWDGDRFELVSSHAVTGLHDAQRPPLEVRLRGREGQRELVLVVVHAKAGGDSASYADRVEFARGLKRHLDEVLATEPRILLGDFNDRLVGSLLPEAPSPYQPFMQDSRYVTPTALLERPDGAYGSFISGAGIDHIVLDARLGQGLRGEADVLRDLALQRSDDFARHVSDHFPVVVQLQL